MQDLDSFISPTLGFEGDIPIPAIPVSAHDPGIKSSQGPSAGSGASASWTWACKRKAPIDPSYQKKAKKAPRKPLVGIMISDPKPKASASTPPSGTQTAFRSSDRKGSLIFNIFFYCLSINPQASMQSASRYPFGLTCKEPCT
jgi:hypothetical protein